MKQVTLNIPDKEYDFFMQLLKKFTSIKVKKEADFVIPESHKQLVRERRKNSKESDLVKWNDVKKSYGL